MKKVLFFDIDGTLLDYNGNMPVSTQKALEQVHLNGHLCIICTGRSSYQLLPWMHERFDGVVSSTGSMVRYQNEVLYEHFIPAEDTIRLWKSFADNGEVLVAQTEERAILSRHSHHFMMDRLQKLGRNEERIKIIMGNALISETGRDCPDIKKFFYHNCKRSYKELGQQFGDVFDIEPSSFEVHSDDSGEITAKGINKAYGMKILLDWLQIPISDTYAFGDGQNDMDMLAFAGVGVAMGNARQVVKELADYVTTDVGDEGIYYALKHLKLI